MTKQEWLNLSEKIVSGTATAEEISTYHHTLASLQQDEMVWQQELHGDEYEVKNMMQRHIAQRSMKARVFPLTRKNLRWAAAFIGVLLTAATTYFYLQPANKGTKQPVAEATNTMPDDIEPGGNKAVLILGNGKQIVLDEASNGELTKQGDIKIIKIDGQLSYDRNQDSHPAEVMYNTVQTPRGGQYRVNLPDGTIVWLNAASSIQFPTIFNGQQRKVKITGEVYFEVAKMQRQPFIVEARGTEIRVLGTHFNVMAYEDEPSVKTSLLEGSVNVTTGKKQIQLNPGQESVANAKGDLRLIETADVENAVAWKNGIFYFERADMESIMRQLSRWYDVEIEYQYKQDDLLYVDFPRNTKLSEALKALELSGTAHFKIENKKVIVMK